MRLCINMLIFTHNLGNWLMAWVIYGSINHQSMLGVEPVSDWHASQEYTSVTGITYVAKLLHRQRLLTSIQRKKHHYKMTTDSYGWISISTASYAHQSMRIFNNKITYQLLLYTTALSKPSEIHLGVIYPSHNCNVRMYKYHCNMRVKPSSLPVCFSYIVTFAWWCCAILKYSHGICN